MADPLFTRDDRISPTWGKLRRWLEAELAERRAHNDKRRDAEETAFTRGDIDRIKAILRLGEEPDKKTQDRLSSLEGDE